MFRNISLKVRLAFSGCVCICSVLFSSGIGLYSLWQSELELEHQLEMARGIKLGMSLDMYHDGIEAHVLHAVILGDTGDTDDKEGLREKLAADNKAMQESVDALVAMDLPGEVGRTARTIKALVGPYAETANGVVEAAFKRTDSGLEKLPNFMALYKNLYLKLEPMAGFIDTLASDSASASKAFNMRLLYINLTFSLMVVVMVVMNIRNIVNSITKPIQRLRDGLKKVSEGEFGMKLVSITRADDFREIAEDIDSVSARVLDALVEQEQRRKNGEKIIEKLRAGLEDLASGDLSKQITERFDDQYDPLRIHFNKTIDTLNILLADVVDASGKIRNRANQLATGAQELSGRTESQAATLEETAAALEEMTTSIKSSADNASQIEDAVTTARADVERSGKVVGGAVDAMNAIEGSSDKISQIIGVIDDIAFQTSLLALNAGVEAARAGEVGRGFAVVASEVRVLAQRSSDAANEIKELIDESTRYVKDGVQKVHSAGDALSDVVSHVTRISDLMTGISRQATEQAQGLGEINMGMGQLDQVTQENASMVDDSSQAIVSLSQETIGLDALVSQFHLMKNRPVETDIYNEADPDEDEYDAGLDEDVVEDEGDAGGDDHEDWSELNDDDDDDTRLTA